MSRRRLFFLALPPLRVRGELDDVLVRHGVDRQLGETLFAPANWHQSLSERIFDPAPGDIERLLLAGDHISAHACTLCFNRIRSSVARDGRIHVTAYAKGEPKAFKELNRAVQQELRDAGYPAIATGVTPHITLSYGAPQMIDGVDMDPPVLWIIDEVLLVLGGGSPYHYEVIGRWPLLPEREPVVLQQNLF